MPSPLAPKAANPEAQNAAPDLTERPTEGDRLRAGLETSSVPDSPTRLLGATGILGSSIDCKIWSTDFRQRLAEDHPLREGFEDPPPDGSAGAVTRLEKLHDAALLVTRIDR